MAVESKVKEDESVNNPPVVMNGMRVVVRLVAVSDGVESAPVEEIVVLPVCPAAKVLAVRREEKKFVEVPLVNEKLGTVSVVPSNVNDAESVKRPAVVVNGTREDVR